MKFSLKINIFRFYFKTILLLIWLKILFSYLSVRLHYFQRELPSNDEVFNFLNLPSDFSSTIEYALLPLLLVFILLYSKYFKPTRIFIFISFLMFGLNIITSFKNGVSLIDSLKFSLKIVTPIYFFCSLLIYQEKTKEDLKKIVFNTIKYCLVLTVLALLFFNPSFNRMENYLPIFFDSIHTHSYLLLSCFIAIAYMLYRKGNRLYLIAFLVLSFLLLYLGYNIRTAVIMYLMFVITMLFLVSDIFKYLILKILVLLPLVVLLFFLIEFEVDLTKVSSGRTEMYVEKLNQLSNFTFFDWLFGQGKGADLIKTDVWWWEKKGAHSDVITFLVENGILYLFLFMLIYFQLSRLLKKNNIIFFTIIFASFFSSLISNGITVRPLANYVFYLMLAYIYLDLVYKKQRNYLGFVK